MVVGTVDWARQASRNGGRADLARGWGAGRRRGGGTRESQLGISSFLPGGLPTASSLLGVKIQNSIVLAQHYLRILTWHQRNNVTTSILLFVRYKIVFDCKLI